MRTALELGVSNAPRSHRAARAGERAAPVVLADGGLGAALEDLSTRFPVTVVVGEQRRRYPPVIESTMWFVTCEALANAIKHAAATNVEVRLDDVDGELRLVVDDDGRGGADPAGSGLRGLADRVEAVGGRLTSRPRRRRYTRRGGRAVRVVIADDAVLWREGLARLLVEAGVEVCALVGDAETLADAVDEHRPDVALVDVRMPPTFTHEGAEIAATLRERWPTMGIMLLSQTLEVRHASALAREHPNGFGYLLKDRVLDVDTLVDALTAIASGGTVLDPDVVGALLGRQHAQSRLARLTARERDVLALVAEGRSNAGIARQLVLTEKTIETHIASVMTKLDLLQTPDDHRRVLAVLAWLDG